ncbi:hypothetical protein SD10_08515 [Spirosoma radiotolerans]|uniref:Uncharacterized protein n=2 Tax=Spirosoma radiotolerans TaxID=1379870 RepID=A0A0E3ZTF3_9BACT|nr:hypothetical protein SD10_08515 [Spirosoma radiotolerans]
MNEKRVWGVLGVGLNYDTQSIHPEDLTEVEENKKRHPHRFWRAVFLCENYNVASKYLTIKDYFGEFRVLNEAFHPIGEQPLFDFGEYVRLKKKPDKLRKVLQINTHSHSKIDDLVYHVEVENGDYWRFYWFYTQLEKV